MNAARKTLIRIAIPVLFIQAALVVACVACGSAFWDVKPMPESYLLHCGTQTCDPRYWQCARTAPVVCEAAESWPYGVKLDAGAR